MSDKPQQIPFSQDVKDVLSLMMWSTGPIAHVLRAGGEAIPTRAEDEQAHVMHWLLNLVLEHGDGWRDAAQARIKAIQDALPPKDAA